MRAKRIPRWQRQEIGRWSIGSRFLPCQVRLPGITRWDRLSMGRCGFRRVWDPAGNTTVGCSRPEPNRDYDVAFLLVKRVKHWLPRVPLTASSPGKTSCKSPAKISALMRVSYKAVGRSKAQRESVREMSCNRSSSRLKVSANQADGPLRRRRNQFDSVGEALGV
jgi:hypothetical protein